MTTLVLREGKTPGGCSLTSQEVLFANSTVGLIEPFFDGAAIERKLQTPSLHLLGR
jgi:hypothetical protein